MLGNLGLIAGIILLVVLVWLVLHLLHSLLKAAIIVAALLLVAYYVFGFSFGLGGVFDFVTSHTDVSEEGVTFSVDNPLNMDSAFVSRVIDGDTVELTTGEKVRLLGINAPETGQSCSLEAKTNLEQLTLNKTVFLEKEIEDTDTYGRLLRYVWVDNTLVNELLVEQGLAHVYMFGEDSEYEVRLTSAQQKAIDGGGCLWKPSEYKDCITVVKFNYDAPGDDNDNLGQEFVILKNNCEDLNLDNWTLKDESASKMYTFSQFTIASEKQFTIYSGDGDNDVDKLYWGSTRAVWNNDGDTLFLRDKDGTLVLVESYTIE
jgi:micrococcal nuclease